MRATHSQDLEKLWDEWIDNRDEEAANGLIAYYMYIVDYHVERVASHLPVSFDRNDLKSFGLIGLYDALTKFDPKRKLKFSTYATIRVRGSMIDGLRKEDWLPRSLREQTKQIENEIAKLEQQLGRTPTAKEVAAETKLDVKEVEEILSHVLFANLLSLETKLHNESEAKERKIADLVEDDTRPSPEDFITLEEITEELAEQIKALNENEQLVISLFYDEELTLTEIGEVLNLSTSRISQIHKQAIFKLRKSLKKLM